MGDNGALFSRRISIFLGLPAVCIFWLFSLILIMPFYGLNGLLFVVLVCALLKWVYVRGYTLKGLLRRKLAVWLGGYKCRPVSFFNVDF